MAETVLVIVPLLEPAVLPVVPAAFIPTVFTSTAPRKAVADVALEEIRKA
jgi:hypothetical protein